MAENMLKYLLFLTSVVSLAKGDFDFKLKYCRLKCGCGNTEENGETSSGPSDYYWRDFYGTIPSDAFPAGGENQYPQTFIGLVFDPLNNGTYVTTIVDGLDYVYNVNKGEVFKKTKRIQILCTKEAERLVWMGLTSDNVSSVSNYLFVSAGSRKVPNKLGKEIRSTFFVVRLSKCRVNYVSATTSIYDELEYAAMDGTLQKSKEKMFLLYKKKPAQNKGTEKSKEKHKNQSFISHYYKYSIRGGSIIPKFFKQINFGSCSLICTNEDISKKKNQENIRSANAMEYYWKPSVLLNEKEAIIVGVNLNKNEYVGQVYSTVNYFDVGESTGKSVTIGLERSSVSQDIDSHILSSNHQEKFEWINTTSDQFALLNRTRMIPGGELYNGTETFVGRELVPSATATSIRVFGSVAYSYSTYGPYGKFEVLMLKEN